MQTSSKKLNRTITIFTSQRHGPLLLNTAVRFLFFCLVFFFLVCFLTRKIRNVILKQIKITLKKKYLEKFQGQNKKYPVGKI